MVRFIILSVMTRPRLKLQILLPKNKTKQSQCLCAGKTSTSCYCNGESSSGPEAVLKNWSVVFGQSWVPGLDRSTEMKTNSILRRVRKKSSSPCLRQPLTHRNEVSVQLNHRNTVKSPGGRSGSGGSSITSHPQSLNPRLHLQCRGPGANRRTPAKK